MHNLLHLLLQKWKRQGQLSVFALLDMNLSSSKSSGSHSSCTADRITAQFALSKNIRLVFLWLFDQCFTIKR